MKTLLLAFLAVAGLASFAGCVVEPEHPRDRYSEHRYDRDRPYDRDRDGDRRYNGYDRR